MITTDYGIYVGNPPPTESRPIRALRKAAPDGRQVVVFLEPWGGNYIGYLENGEMWPGWIPVTDEEAAGTPETAST